jgi:hypothetical protein
VCGVKRLRDGPRLDGQCCRIESRADREGITASYDYDGLKRVILEVRAGITNEYTYDAEG